jgi:hypothetical protein
VSVTIEARDRDRRTVLGRLASRNQHVTDLVEAELDFEPAGQTVIAQVEARLAMTVQAS